jgi:hypothetical protein
MPKRRCTAKRGMHEVDRDLLDRKTGPGGDELNCDLRSNPRSALARGLHAEFLKHLNGEGKIRAQKDSPGNRTFFCLHLSRADGVQKNVCINEARHGNKVPRALPDEKPGSVQPWHKTPPGDAPIF